MAQYIFWFSMECPTTLRTPQLIPTRGESLPLPQGIVMAESPQSTLFKGIDVPRGTYLPSDHVGIHFGHAGTWKGL